MLKKAVIPAAGLGTRLLPITKELPKEMLPIVALTKNGKLCMKPMLQAIFEQLYDVRFREFAFIVGKGKRAIEDHFSPDEDFIQYLESKNRKDNAEELQDFYRKINESNIVFINQPKPKGFGDAVGRASLFTGSEKFLMQAGDDLVISQNNNHLRRATETFEEYDADTLFVVEEVPDPRNYGVVTGKEIKPGIFQVANIVEKPQKPQSNLAIVAIYMFKPIIYKAIKEVKPDKNGEIQLAEALQLLIDWNCKVFGLKLGSDEKRIDIGTAESYLEMLKSTVIGK
ncbi:MAG: sugar phosphate nucleotidyltransferase [Candidatus Bathyarchaeia archaeon]